MGAFNRALERIVECSNTFVEVETFGQITHEDLGDLFPVKGPIHTDRTITSIEIADAAAEELFDEIMCDEKKALDAQLPKPEQMAAWRLLLPEE